MQEFYIILLNDYNFAQCYATTQFGSTRIFLCFPDFSALLNDFKILNSKQ